MRAAVLALALGALASTAVDAQFSPGARSAAMGGAGMVFASGVDAVELNPANLADHVGISVSALEVGAASLSTGATFDEIIAIFGGDFLGSADVNVPQVIAGLPDGGIGLSLVSEGYGLARALDAGNVPRPGSAMPSIGVAVGSLGIRTRSRVLFDFTVSKELADLIGNGFDEARIQEYAVGNTGFRSIAYSEITAAYARTVGGLLDVGLALRYVQGNSLADGRFFEPVLDMTSTPRTLSLESVVVESQGGSGFGLDIGVTLDLPMGFTAAISGTNLIQRMNWDEPLYAHSATFTDSQMDATDFFDLLDQYSTEVVDPSSVSLPVYQAAQGLFEESYFPTIFRGGVGLQRGGTSMELVGVSVSPRGRQRTAWDQRISLGIEQRIPVLTLRAGLARAEDGVQALSGGIGLRMGPVHLDTGGGYFSGDDGAASVYDGYHATVSLQVRVGGS